VEVRAGRLEPVDCLVWHAVTQCFEINAARSWCEPSDLVDATALPLTQVEESLARLLEVQLLAVHRDIERPVWWHFVLPPQLISAGRLSGQVLAWRRWQEALALGLPVPKPGEKAPSQGGWRAQLERCRAELAAPDADGVEDGGEGHQHHVQHLAVHQEVPQFEPATTRKRSSRASQKRSQDPVAAAA